MRLRAFLVTAMLLSAQAAHAQTQSSVQLGQGGSILTTESNSHDEIAEKIAADLEKDELKVPFGSGSGKEAMKDIALLDLQLEEMRMRYAQELQLHAEGIVSAHQVQQARSAYERVQVQLAGKVGAIPRMVRLLAAQRELANKLSEVSFARVISKTDQPDAIRPAVAKPAPSLIPGHAPHPGGTCPHETHVN